jgi:hypothetical protein
LTRLTSDTETTQARRSGKLGWLLLICVAATPVAAHAQSGPQERAAAETLFQESKKLMNAGKVPEACRKLEESQKLDPRAGTLITLAMCHRKEGRVATAWVEFQEALALAKKAGRMDRVALAQKELNELEPKLPRLAVAVPKTSFLPGLVVRRDGEEIGAALWDTAVPVDPGEHTFEASAPGRKPWHSKAEIREGEETRVSVPLLEALPPPPPASSAPVAKPRSYAGVLIAGGVGVAAIGIGAYFGMRAISKRSSSDEHCHGSLCDPEGVDLNRQAKASANVANVAFGVGIVGIGVATWLLLSGSSQPKPAAAARTVRVLPVPGPREAAILVQTVW